MQGCVAYNSPPGEFHQVRLKRCHWTIMLQRVRIAQQIQRAVRHPRHEFIWLDQNASPQPVAVLPRPVDTECKTNARSGCLY
jgi:hypothetical protein